MEISRREFTKLGALGLASQAIPNAFAQGSDRKVGYCVIGLGRIADHFLRGVKDSKTSQITGLVSGHRDKALKIAAQYGVPETSIYSYEQMDAMRSNKAIDAVYVALPNSMHAEYTIRSAKAGKHVLCEKPMATSVADSKAMIAACKLARVKLMIAYRLHFEPTNLRAIKLIRDGALGKVQSIISSNGFNIAQNEWRTNKKLAGGGPLMDVGVYSLNATRYLTGEEPVSIKSHISTIDHDDPRFSTVEENTTWAMKFPSGILATCDTTYGASMPGFYRVYGSKGWLEVGSFNYADIRLQASYVTAPGTPATKMDETNKEPDPMQFTREADHFTDCILHDKIPQPAGEEGLRDMQYMQMIYRASGITAL